MDNNIKEIEKLDSDFEIKLENMGQYQAFDTPWRKILTLVSLIMKIYHMPRILLPQVPNFQYP